MAEMTNRPTLGQQARGRGNFSAPRRDDSVRPAQRNADTRDGTSRVALSARLAALTHYSGAIVSVALLIGMGVWGYKLVVRDVSGIPVVRAALGPMRETPVDPGGNLALNTGLAVNDIAALGQSGEQGDRLMLAPETAGLTEDDLLVQPTAERDEFLPNGVGEEVLLAANLGDETMIPDSDAAALAAPESADAVSLSPGQPMSADEILAFADQIAAGAAPLTELSQGTDAPVALSLEGADAVSGALNDVLTETADEVVIISTSIPGVTTVIRPPARPAGLQVASAAAIVTLAPVAAAPTVIPAGATLVQLGAFETAEIATAEWAKLSERFGEFMAGKERVVQAATSGGREFYRLRAMGFDNFDDAGRFCAALVAEGALCIPVAGG